jgi:hypothetical protein
MVPEIRPVNPCPNIEPGQQTANKAIAIAAGDTPLRAANKTTFI